MFKRLAIFVAIALMCGLTANAQQGSVDAKSIMIAMIEATRSDSSFARLRMEIKRENWQRVSEFSMWTRGLDDALMRFTGPPKQAGNATLKLGNDIWTYSPTIKRSIRLPRSMMSQEWAGSDFSYNDLARSASALEDYDFQLTNTEIVEGQTIYTIAATPKPDSPVVWGQEVTRIRADDYVVLEQVFLDQDMQPVKVMRTSEIGSLGGRTIPLRMRIADSRQEERWTEIQYVEADFDADIADRTFTQFALRGEI